MPGEEVKINDTQSSIFEERLSDSLNPQHKLYKLTHLTQEHYFCVNLSIHS
ncbi:MAG: hypothetical protein ACRY3E_05250 [Candidatus Lariskella arthropodorum]